MDGTTLEQLLTPEKGQVTDPASDPAPAATDPAQPGQVAEPPAAAEDPTSGQGTQSDPPVEEVVSKKQYDELRKTFTQKAMRLAQLEKQLSEMPPAQQQESPTAAPVGSLQEFIQRQVMETVSGMVAPIQQQQQDLRIQTKVMELSEDNEFEDVAPAFLELLAEQPELLDSDKSLTLAYKAAKADYLEKVSTARLQATLAASKQLTAQKLSNTDPALPAKAAPQLGTEESEAQKILESITGLGTKSSIF